MEHQHKVWVKCCCSSGSAEPCRPSESQTRDCFCPAKQQKALMWQRVLKHWQRLLKHWQSRGMQLQSSSLKAAFHS